MSPSSQRSRAWVGNTIHPSAEQVLRWFDSGHLPDHLSDIVRPIERLAVETANVIQEGPELTAGLRKLLEAKDCFVRAAIARDEQARDEYLPEGFLPCIPGDEPHKGGE